MKAVQCGVSNRMAPPIEFRPARPEDAPGIVAVIRSGFDEALLHTFIYGCRGIVRFVEEQIGIGAPFSDTVYTVASYGTRVVGCVELRRGIDDLFLSYISFHPEYREQGLGKRLLGAAIDSGYTPAHASMSLDVLEQNARARTWYMNMGFVQRSSTDWWKIPIPPGERDMPFLICDYPQANACHREFGFSRFRVVTPTGTYAVGRLGDSWYRIVQPDALSDKALLSALWYLDSSRSILALFSDASHTRVPADLPRRRLATTFRLTCDMARLRENLTEKE